MAELILSDGTRTYDLLASTTGIYAQADGINLPVVGRDDTYVETPDSDGRRRVRTRATNPEGSFSVFINQTTAALFWDDVDNLQELVESVHRKKGTLTYTPPGGSQVTYDIESISVTDLPQRGVTLRQFYAEATVTFECKPYGRLPEVSVPILPAYADRIKAFGELGILLPLTATAGLVDLSGNGRDGTANGGMTVGGSSPGPLGRNDADSTAFISTHKITTSYSAFTAASTRTFMGWAYRDDSSTADCLMGSDGTDAVVISMLSGSNNINFEASVSGAGTTIGTGPGNAQWFHWAVVFNDSTNAVQLFINGVAQTATTHAVAYAASGTSGSPQWGSHSTNSTPFSGKMAWVSIHERGLTAGEIAAAHEAGSATTPYSISLTGPIDFFPVEGTPGQVDALGHARVDDPDSVSRSHLEVGVQHNYDPDNPDPILLQAVTDITALAGSSNTRTGSYSTNVIRTTLTTTPVAVCSAEDQPHYGKWKVRARIYPSAPEVRVRLAWRTGSAGFTTERWVKSPGEDDWFDVDLGTVDITQLPSGHTSEFRVVAMSTSGVPTVDVDILTMIPADNHSRLRGAITSDTTVGGLIAADDFDSHTEGVALSGLTPPLAPSGNWSGAGDSVDFTTYASLLYRSEANDATAGAGRFARCGTGVLAGTVAEVSYEYQGGATSTFRGGLLLRYTDTNNYLVAAYIGPTSMALIKVVAGTPTVLALATGTFTGGRRIRCEVDTAGNVVVYDGNPYDSALSRIMGVTADSSLATSGALDDGGYGIYDAETGGVTAFRFYDDFLVSAFDGTVANPAINADYGLDLLHNTARSDNAAGTGQGVTPIREGEYLTLPPATRNGEVSRVVVRARRDDVDAGFADSGLTDDLTATLSVTPRVHLLGP